MPKEKFYRVIGPADDNYPILIIQAPSLYLACMRASNLVDEANNRFCRFTRHCRVEGYDTEIEAMSAISNI